MSNYSELNTRNPTNGQKQEATGACSGSTSEMYRDGNQREKMEPPKTFCDPIKCGGLKNWRQKHRWKW